ncbi:lytic transglycosylase domain-containing protein [Sandaracinobacter sp. RS1-74]|uniref:lytic transglycosylase domain-containing protein n=1 Tax=Sandaracinobacteroides sayramensis TaxID=2913411 RepID=UPI001ED9EF7A|nr:lytic transglycosylase domain-containing protein [Sandaracinobacteroides sayramensis]MCG2841288.1 lytic transglycosylase domain-containing protein [Sandaracinobacteroides sayramensis]
MRIVRSFAAIAACVVAIVAQPLAAKSRPSDETRIALCIREASRGQLWLERTLWGLRDQEAGWLGAEIRNTNGSHDLGPLQVNSWWVPRFAKMLGRAPSDIRHWLRYDACFNVEAARWIFLSALEQAGGYWKAVGLYHSPTAWRQQRYAALVAGKMRARFGTEMFASAMAPPAAAMMSVRGVSQSVPRADVPTRRIVTYHGFGKDTADSADAQAGPVATDSL